MMKSLLLAFIVGTWNGQWFPSGRAEHRMNPEVEAATMRASGRMIARGLKAVDTNGTEDVILVFNEIRNREVAETFVNEIRTFSGRTNLQIAAMTEYRRRDNRLDYQQDFIATTLPVVESRWANWNTNAVPAAPRGYAFASIVVEPAVTARVYGVHLKSNYGSSNPETAAMNRAMRANAVAELMALETNETPVIIAGDLNADKWRKLHPEEKIFALFETNRYDNALEKLTKRARWTYPNRRYGNSALDYVMSKGFLFAAKPIKVPNEYLSDHFALMVLMRTKPNEEQSDISCPK